MPPQGSSRKFAPRSDSVKGMQKDKALAALRIACLFHDCAQGPFSHISDRICNDYIKLGHYGEERINPTYNDNMHEFVALDILTCNSFQTFLSNELSLDQQWIQSFPYSIVGNIRNRDSDVEYLVTVLLTDYLMRTSSTTYCVTVFSPAFPCPLDTERLIRMVRLRL